MTGQLECPNCGAKTVTLFYEVEHVPTNSVMLLPTRQAAFDYPTGDIRLGFCGTCGFISNTAFNPRLTDYTAEYESTQSFSPTYNAFARKLATNLVERHNLRGKTILEIGSGQGEFLALLCEIGGNRGIGFDPAYTGRSDEAAGDHLAFVADFYSEKYADQTADFVVCKMTLEHIPQTGDFIRMVRRAVGDQPNTLVFFQVPNAVRVLKDIAFWDIYYEHCSYFSPGALAYVFRQSGFNVIDLYTDYDDQYLMIVAQPSSAAPSAKRHPLEEEFATLKQHVDTFTETCAQQFDSWRNRLAEVRKNSQKAVIWGGGSKGVAFLTTLGIRDEIQYAVDINPRKRGTFMAGTGQEIVLPEFLKEYQPDLVIAMNAVYCNEIQQQLDAMRVNARLLAL